MKRVLITGVSGFVGSHLCRKLAASNFLVLGTYRTIKPAKIPRSSYVKLDLSVRPEVNKVIAAFRPDFVYHLAAQSLSSGSMPIERQTLRTNTVGTLFLLDALRRYSPNARVLLASSSHSYGKTLERKPAVSETDLLWPQNPYGVSKVLAELACREFASRFGLKTVIARSFNHIGAGQRQGLVFTDWCRQVVRIERGRQSPVLEVGNIDVKRDFMHIDDVVRAYQLLMAKGKSGEVYNVCSHRLYSLRIYLKFLLRKTKKRIRIKQDPSKIRRFEPMVIGGNSSKIHKLGWRPECDAFDAIEEILSEWREKRNL